MNDRKQIKDAFAGLDTDYYCRLSTTENNEKRWCISYYYYVTDENKELNHTAIVNETNKQIAEILMLLKLQIKNYKITGGIWARKGKHTTHINDIVLNI